MPVSHTAHCHRCLLHQPPPYSGTMACTVDGADVVKHSAHGYCPHPAGPRFGTSAMPLSWASAGLGDAVKKVLDATGIGAVVRRLKPKGCGGCAERQKALNKAMPFKS